MTAAAATDVDQGSPLSAAQGLVRSVFDAWESHVAVLATDGTIEMVNQAWERFAADNGGASDAVGVGVDYFAVCARAAVTDASAAATLQGLRRVLAGDLPEYVVEYPCHAPDEQRWFRLRARPMTVADETRLLVVHDDVTDRTQLQHDVRARSLLLDQIDAAVIATDLAGRIELWSRAAEHLYDWSADEAVGRLLHELLVPVDADGVAHDLVEAVTATGAWEGELTVDRADGSTFPAHVRAAHVHDEADAPTGIVVVSLDLSVRVAMQEQLGRSNRELKAITDSIGDGLCVLDADGRITYVNPRGQRLLDVYVTEALGVRLTTWLSEGTQSGSDGLIAIDPDHPVESLVSRADGSTVPVEYVATPLVGINDHEPGGWVVVFRDITERRAREGRIAEQVDQAMWLGRIRQALDTDGFVLYAQPIFDVRTGEAVQHELLIRMRDPDDPDAIIPPGKFLPVAEELGLAPAIDRWVLLHGLRLAATGMPVQINLSATSLDDPTLPHLLEQLLDETGADPATVIFEITETALLNSDVQAARFAVKVHELGCRLALDDFGTGYGGFTYLKQLPIDELKIDIEFVRDATTNPASRHVIDAVVSLARAFGLHTVGEGVEDQATLDILKQLHVDYAQGYHLGRPAPIDGPTARP